MDGWIGRRVMIMTVTGGFLTGSLIEGYLEFRGKRDGPRVCMDSSEERHLLEYLQGIISYFLC